MIPAEHASVRANHQHMTLTRTYRAGLRCRATPRRTSPVKVVLFVTPDAGRPKVRSRKARKRRLDVFDAPARYTGGGCRAHALLASLGVCGVVGRGTEGAEVNTDEATEP